MKQPCISKHAQVASLFYLYCISSVVSLHLFCPVCQSVIQKIITTACPLVNEWILKLFFTHMVLVIYFSPPQPRHPVVPCLCLTPVPCLLPPQSLRSVQTLSMKIHSMFYNRISRSDKIPLFSWHTIMHDTSILCKMQCNSF